MRKIVRWIRIPEEPWENTMRRMATRVNFALGQSNVKQWSIRIDETPWKFAARLKNMPLNSWASRAAYWQPHSTDDPSCDSLPHRERGRPCMRWDDKATKFCWRHFGQKL